MHSHSSFWKQLWAEKWVILGLILLTLAIEHLGLLRSFETSALDTVLRIKGPVTPRFVRVVAITEADFKSPKLFGGRSPLDQQKVIEIITAIGRAQPAVIAVDLDTAEWEPLSDAQKEELTGSRLPIIWAQDFIATGEGHEHKPLGVLGGTAASFTGLAAMIADWDGVVRRYRRAVPLGAHDGAMDSLPWATVKAAVPRLQSAGEKVPSGTRKEVEGRPRDEPLALNFAADRYEFAPIPASLVLQLAGAPAWGTNGPLTSKVVLFGQEHHATRDEYMTPVGMKSGLRIVAQAVENELQHRTIGTAGFALMILIDLAGAVIIIAFQHYLGPRPAFWLSLATIPVVALGGSFLAFSTLSYWVSFVPILLGVFLHQLQHHLVRYRQMCRALEASGHAG